jgi:hypothetical protein
LDLNVEVMARDFLVEKDDFLVLEIGQLQRLLENGDTSLKVAKAAE